LADTLRRAGLTPSEVLSKRSRAYKSLGLAERQLGDDELLDLMVQEPTLLRRPLILSPGGVTVGFNQKELQALVESSENEPSRKEE
jgi:arsenate reductase-like glutaredoxin family protein